MYSVRINNRKFSAEDGTPLKEILAEYGLVGDNSKVLCPLLSVDKGDRECLTEEEIAKGLRIAEGKTVERSLFLTCAPAPKKQGSSCRLLLAIAEKNIDIAVIGDTVQEEYSFPSPLPPLSELLQQSLPGAETERLQMFLKKKCTEVLPLGVAEAHSITVISSGLYIRVLLGLPQDIAVDYADIIKGQTLGLPAKKVDILSPADEIVGAELFCLTAKHKENTFVLDCEDNLTLAYIDKDNSVYALLWSFDYTEVSLLFLQAALRTLRPQESHPFAYLYGENAYAVEEALENENIPYAHGDKSLLTLKNPFEPSFFTLMESEKKRTSFHDLLKDEQYQEELIRL